MPINRKIKSWLSKLNFYLGRNPAIERNGNYREWIPEGYQAAITICADFELAWAWRYSKNHPAPVKNALDKARQERENIPHILHLLEQYEIPITWATIGHLFLECCERHSGRTHSELPRLSHFESEFWRYRGTDWFEHDPGTDLQRSPEWYAPDLIKQILDSKTSHEIACHTFSHIDCTDEICPPEVFEKEVELCKSIARQWNIDLRTFVHPGHTAGNLDSLRRLGFTSFRTNNRNLLGYPVIHPDGLVEFEQTTEIAYRKEWSIDYHIYRYKKIIDRAVKNHSVCYMWFHPSFDPVCSESVFPAIIEYIHSCKKDLWVGTSGKYVDLLYERNTKKK